jgi:hypothetical protein
MKVNLPFAGCSHCQSICRKYHIDCDSERDGCLVPKLYQIEVEKSIWYRCDCEPGSRTDADSLQS